MIYSIFVKVYSTGVPERSPGHRNLHCGGDLLPGGVEAGHEVRSTLGVFSQIFVLLNTEEGGILTDTINMYYNLATTRLYYTRIGQL